LFLLLQADNTLVSKRKMLDISQFSCVKLLVVMYGLRDLTSQDSSSQTLLHTSSQDKTRLPQLIIISFSVSS